MKQNAHCVSLYPCSYSHSGTLPCPPVPLHETASSTRGTEASPFPDTTNGSGWDLHSLAPRGMEERLRNHPDRSFAQFIVSGIEQGYRIGFDRSKPLQSGTNNLFSALQAPQVIDDTWQTN